MRGIQELANKFLPPGVRSRNVTILAGGTALSQAFAVLITPILTRLYPAEDFGYFQMYMSIMAFAALAVTLRYEQAIFLPEQEGLAANLVAVTFCGVVVMSVVLGATVWLVHRNHLLPRSLEGLQPYLWLVALGVCGAGVYQTLSFWALRQKEYPRVAKTKLTQSISQFSTQAIAGLLQSGPLGLMLGDAIGRMNGSINLGRLVLGRDWKIFTQVNWKTMWTAAVRYRRFPLISSWSALLNIGAYALPPLIIAQFYGPKTLGWFALGDRVLGAPAMLIGQAVSQVYSVDAANLSLTNPEQLRMLFLRSVKRLALLGIIPFLVFVTFSPMVFGFVFGQAWREAGQYARLLALMHYVAFVSWPVSPTLNILEQQFWQLGWDVGRLALTCGSLWFSYHWNTTARGAIGALGFAMLLGYIAHLFLCHYAIRRRLKAFRITSQIQDPVEQQCVELGNL